MKIDRSSRAQLIAFSLFAGILLAWFVYAGLTGWRLWGGSSNQQTWSSKGPGYHK